MANTLTNFLVGVGFDYDQKGQREIGSGIDSIKSKALQLGSVVAGAFGIKALTVDFAASRDEIGKFSDVFGVLPADVFALGKALEHEGGSVDAFMSQLSNLEKMRAGIIAGDAGFIGAAGRAGITDTSIITNAENATEAYIALADVFQRLSGQERLNAADALGFDDSSIRLLSQGSDAVRSAIASEKEMRIVTEQMTEESARFNDGIQDLFSNVGGFADKASMNMLPAINDIVDATNEWIGVNRTLINQNLDSVLEPIGKNFGTIAAAGGLLASGGLLAGLAGMAKNIPIIGQGMRVAFSAASKLSVLGAGAVIGTEILSIDGKSFLQNFGIDAPDWFTKPVKDLEWSDFGIGESDDKPPASDENFPDVPDFGESDNFPDVPNFDMNEFPEVPMFGSARTPVNTSSSSRSEITVNMMLDGQLIDQRIVNVVDGQAELAYQDIKSTVVS
jgi:hypothetical protein